MLVQLLSEQVAEYWNIIKYAVEGSLPPIANEAYDKMNRILEALLTDQMQCWVSYREEESGRVLEGILITTITGDFCSDIKSLLVYSLYGFNATEQAWAEGFSTISKWAKSKGCNRIIAYTDVPRIIEIIQQLGGEAKYSLVSLPL
jgi:hypothetical protein